VSDQNEIPSAPSSCPEEPFTAEEQAVGLVAYHRRLMVWPEGDIADPKIQTDPNKFYGTGLGLMLERSPKWRQARYDWVVHHQPQCMLCWGSEKLQVHHKFPFHLHPELELDPTNFITLCEGGRGVNCHYLAGHGCDWKRYTQQTDELVAQMRTLIFVRLQPVTRMALEEAVVRVLGARLLRRDP
jgi:5-methylcytosine-specific restriction endonuclease McrA